MESVQDILEYKRHLSPSWFDRGKPLSTEQMEFRSSQANTSMTDIDYDCQAKLELEIESFYEIERQLAAEQRAWAAVISEKKRYDAFGWQAGTDDYKRALHACLHIIPKGVTMELPGSGHCVQQKGGHDKVAVTFPNGAQNKDEAVFSSNLSSKDAMEGLFGRVVPEKGGGLFSNSAPEKGGTVGLFGNVAPKNGGNLFSSSTPEKGETVGLFGVVPKKGGSLFETSDGKTIGLNTALGDASNGEKLLDSLKKLQHERAPKRSLFGELEDEEEVNGEAKRKRLGH